MLSKFQISMSRMARLCFFCALLMMSKMATAQTGGIPQVQYNALVTLYNSTGGSNWSVKDNWLSNEPVETWYGLTVIDGNVVGINLPFNNLVGTIPAQVANLPLTDLSVSSNSITAVGTLPITLTNLDISSNQIATLASLPANLQFFNAAANLLTYLPSLPVNLLTLNVSFNKLTFLPKLPATLVSINCSTNRIVLLPSIPALVSTLDCSNNKLLILPKLPLEISTLIANNNCLVVLPTLPDALTFINVSFNQLFSLPTLPANGSLFLLIANNRLTFEDLEPIISRFRTPLQYSPQAEVGFAYKLNATAGSTINLSANYAGNTANTRYVWVKDSVAITDTLISPILTISNVQTINSGIYTTRITSKLVKGLVLIRKPITVTVSGSSSASETSLQVYPNPVVSSLKITKPTGWADKVSVIIVSERNGAEVYKSTYTFGQSIELSFLSAGNYIIRISDGVKTNSSHLIKD